MNNLPDAPGKFTDEAGIITPQIVLNADITDDGKLIRRDGYSKIINLPGAHSLWRGSVVLCVAIGVQYSNALWSITGQNVTERCAVEGPRVRLNYVELGNLVFMSSPAWTGVYDLLTGGVRSWGVSRPPAPAFSLDAGEMPPGKYLLCYTRIENGRLSGQGPIVEVQWDGMDRKVMLSNFQPTYQCWITHPNGGELFLARVVNNQIVDQAPGIQKLPTFEVIPAPRMAAITYGHGRIWGCQGKKLFYSDPNQYEQFKSKNFLPFLEDLVMVAPVVSGLIVASLDNTWFLEGQDPGKMKLMAVGKGAIPGTLTFALVEGGGYEISRKQSQLPSPVWMDKHGWVVGTHNGHLVYWTEHRLRIPTKAYGASVARKKAGVPQIISSLFGNPLNGEDPILKGIHERNKLYVPKPLTVKGRGGVIIS